MSAINQRKKVLILCTGNSCRSQMAEAILRDIAGAEYDVMSAGTHPTEVNPLTVRALQEINVDTSNLRAKSVKAFLGHHRYHTVMFACAEAENACPAIFPFANTLVSWGFDDPAEATGSDEERMEVFRRVRDEIRGTLVAWVSEQTLAADPG